MEYKWGQGGTSRQLRNTERNTEMEERRTRRRGLDPRITAQLFFIFFLIFRM